MRDSVSDRLWLALGLVMSRERVRSCDLVRMRLGTADVAVVVKGTAEVDVLVVDIVVVVVVAVVVDDEARRVVFGRIIEVEFAADEEADVDAKVVIVSTVATDVAVVIVVDEAFVGEYVLVVVVVVFSSNEDGDVVGGGSTLGDTAVVVVALSLAEAFVTKTDVAVELVQRATPDMQRTMMKNINEMRSERNDCPLLLLIVCCTPANVSSFYRDRQKRL